jgi:hypothetical protein
MTISLDYDDWPTLEGRQEAQYLLVDDGNPAEAIKAIALASRVRKAQMPWQEDTLRGVLTTELDGMFTHPVAVVIAPRQNGKTLSAADLRILYGAFVRRETIVYSAQRWITAKAIYLRLKTMINSRPSLKARTFGWLCSQGIAGFTVKHDDGTESVTMFITRSADFRGPDQIDLVIYDEAYNLTDGEIAAISPTQLAAVNPQTIYLSSAVNQEVHANGEVLTRLRRRALAAIKSGQQRIGVYYREHAAPEPPSGISDAERQRIREDPATHKLANPSYGVIHSAAKVLKLQVELSPKAFEVEVLGWGDWPVDPADAVSLINPQVWQGWAVSNPQLIGPRAVSIDRDPDSLEWIAAAAQNTSDGRIFIEVGYCSRASSLAVIRHVVEVATALNPIVIATDSRSDAASLKPDLELAGIELTATNTTEYGLACTGFLNDALDGRLAHGNQRILNGSVDIAERKDLPRGGFIWASKPGLGVLRAATLARWALLEFAPVKKRAAGPAFGASKQTETAHPQDDSTELDVMSAAF